MMNDDERLSQQIYKAATILDLKGDFPRAIEVLKNLLEDSAISQFPQVKLEVLVFLADIHRALEDKPEARKYIALAEEVNVSGFTMVTTGLGSPTAGTRSPV
ncbi:tol-pal system YbgF family protein [Acidobacteriota bacterium]